MQLYIFIHCPWSRYRILASAERVFIYMNESGMLFLVFRLFLCNMCFMDAALQIYSKF